IVFIAPKDELIAEGGFKAPTDELLDKPPASEPGIFDKIGEIVKQYKDTQMGSPQDLLEHLDSLVSKGFDKAGQFGAEQLAKEGMNPNASAAVGTVIQLAPELARLIGPTES